MNLERQNNYMSIDVIKRTEERENKTELLTNQLKQVLADFDNYKKRVKKEVDNIKQLSIEDFALDILDVYDNLERGLKAISRNSGMQDNNSYIQGLQMSLKSFRDTLEKHGCVRMNVIGTKFDSNFHDAKSIIPGSAENDGRICDEIRSGWMIGSKVLRPSEVVVYINDNCTNVNYDK